MLPDVTVDVGNTRIKWGRCLDHRVVGSVSLPPDDVPAWEEQCRQWRLDQNSVWVLGGVQPRRQQALVDWLARSGQRVLLLEDWRQLGLRVLLEAPNAVGIDRLLDAVAVNSRRKANTSAAIVDAGSAVTVDWVDADGAFRGGAILPGIRLMAKALHEHTALLPEIVLSTALPLALGKSTPEAMQSGIYWSVVGGIQRLIAQMSGEEHPQVWLTGGDAPLLAPALGASVEIWPTMTLEGIRLAAERLP